MYPSKLHFNLRPPRQNKERKTDNKACISVRFRKIIIRSRQSVCNWVHVYGMHMCTLISVYTLYGAAVRAFGEWGTNHGEVVKAYDWLKMFDSAEMHNVKNNCFHQESILLAESRPDIQIQNIRLAKTLINITVHDQYNTSLAENNFIGWNGQMVQMITAVSTLWLILC